MKRSYALGLLIVIFLGMSLSACNKVDLYQDLSEEDANEILVLLSENGIKATKKKEMKQNEVSYIISVSEEDMVQARSLLVSHNLPRRRELGLTGVYKEKGLIPTPDEQKARYLLALKGEIINSLQRIPEIVDIDVVLNVPTKDEFAGADVQHRQRPTASVVVRVQPDRVGTDAITEAKVQQFVANAVEGLNPRDVTVVISYLPTEERMVRPGDVRTLDTKKMERPTTETAQQMPSPVMQELIGLNLDEASKGRLKIYLLIFFVVLIILSVTLIVVIVQGGRMRRDLAAMQHHMGDMPAIEGHLMDEGPPQIEEGGHENEF